MLRKEIGSEFWDIPRQYEKNDMFPCGVEWFISGRSALNFIIQDIKKTSKHIKTAHLPSYCCHTMIQPFLDNDIEVTFYPVTMSVDGFVCDYLDAEKKDIVLCLDFFGFVGRNNLPKNFGGIVIDDLTHSILCKTERRADYCFGSLRKWAAFPTGGFAWKTKNPFELERLNDINIQYVSLRKEAFKEKQQYMDCTQSSKAFLSTFASAEKILECDKKIYSADKEDVINAFYLDINTMVLKRRENANFLIEELKKYSIYKKVGANDVPLFVPITVRKDMRSELRQHLIDNEIFCPIHWPKTSLHRTDDETEQLYEEEISLICDQRYSLNDMEREVDVINSFFRAKG